MNLFSLIAPVSLFFLVLTAKTTTAQDSVNYYKNELKFNLLSGIAALPEVSYERLVKSNNGIGIAMAFGIGNVDEFSFYKVLVIPYYRVYFGDVEGAGLFIEANMGFAGYKESETIYNSYLKREYTINGTKFNFGIGGAVGKKYLAKNGFSGEVFGGVGKFFGDNRSVNVYPRLGLTLGKRF